MVRYAPRALPVRYVRAVPGAQHLYRLSLTVLGTVLLAHMVGLHGWDGDVLMDVANGRWILAHHTVPLSNQLNPTLRGAFWSEPEWLYGVMVAFFWHLGGRWGVYWGLMPWLAATVYAVVRVTEPAGRLWGTMLTLAGVISLHGFMSPRPQLVSYALFAVGLWAMQRWRAGVAWPVWTFAALASVWTQMHPSAILDPLLLVGEVLFGPRRRGLGPPILLAFLGWSLRPGGVWGTGGLMTTLFAPAIRTTIREWAPWQPFSAMGWIFGPWMLAVPGVVLVGWHRRDATAVVWALVGAAMTALAVRFAPYFLLGMAAIGGEWLRSPHWMTPVRDRVWTGHLVAGTVAVAALFGATVRFPVQVPVAALALLRQAGVHEVLAYYPWGDALDLYGPPSFADGRAELWSRQPWWPAYVRTNRGQESPARFVARWAPRVNAIVWPAGLPGTSQLARNPQWRHLVTMTSSGQRVSIWLRRP
ncbi:hypothetical protein [Sulfobacillus thermosulfidooxidans]|uniref:hypothetical protein n=1 Tax=Sulfobacillus thermosulfidooxidans TaxID=28034 RepID=UPI0002EFBEA0|nr:hypothetical protein [Sulfobacillus thermosulfidooxidans]